MTPEEARAQAKQKLKGICGVYKACDGDPSRLCQNQIYGGPMLIGGAGSGASFANNYKDLQSIQIRMQVIGEHFTPDTHTALFGKRFEMPIYGAPVTGVNSFGGESVMREEDFCEATVEGCKQAGTIAFRGDTATYRSNLSPGIDAIAKAGGHGIKIIKPRSQNDIITLIRLAEEAGALAVGVDVDGCGSYMMNTNNQPVFRKSKSELQELIRSTCLPFVVKGIMCVEDAIAATEAGAQAIVVSNHGGRVLDCTPGTATVLPAIAQAVGAQTTVLVDGGVRTGTDVLKMLALGAKGVLIGRDIIRAAVGGGTEGVKGHMLHLKKTLASSMLMTGCQTLADITPHILHQ
jgi:isopentenyl diphosphate isomerase/L-lactate dehydrogenase-like FMN-dependent dehydrogenase